MISEYEQLRSKYQNFSFNDHPAKRNKRNWLIAFEPYVIHPSNYDFNVINQYKGYITWNSKFMNNPHITVSRIKLNGFPICDNYLWIDEFKKYEDKIDGICLMSKNYNQINMEIGDIRGKRIEILSSIKGMVKHCYGMSPYGDEMYKGKVGETKEETWPSSKSKFNKLNEYKFNLCFENAYHPIHSFDFITEKITDSFKAKVIPVYWGCYNIEQYIPKKLFVDFRDYNGIDDLEKRLKEISKSEYEDMIGSAFEFIKSFKMGDINEFKEVLDKL